MAYGNKVEPITPGHIPTSDDDIAVFPEYELPSYEPVSFSMPEMKVSEAQVEQKMMEYAESLGTDYEDTDRKVVGPKEDIEIGIEVSKDGTAIPNLTSEARMYTLGAGLMPIDFDRGVLGMKVGEEKEFDFKAPDFDDPEHSESVFQAKVKILKIKRRKKPEITDEWVAAYMPLYKSAKEFKDGIREGLMQEADRVIGQEKNQRAAYALAERFNGRIDDYWYEVTRSDLKKSYEEQAKAQHMDLQDFLGKQNIEEQQFSMMLMMQSREMLYQGFSLDAWARHYEIEPTEEDMVAFCEMMSPGHGAELMDRIKNDDNAEKELDGINVATRRWLANEDVVKKATITIDNNAQ